MISTNEIVRTYSVGVSDPHLRRFPHAIDQRNNEFHSLDEICVGSTRVGVTLIHMRVGQTPHAKPSQSQSNIHTE